MFQLHEHLYSKRKDRYRFAFPLKNEEVPLCISVDESKSNETHGKNRENDKDSELLSCLAHHAGDDDFESLKSELFNSKLTRAMEIENRLEKQGYVPNFSFIQDVVLKQIVSQQPHLNHLYYSFDSSSYKLLDILTDELLKYHVQQQVAEQANNTQTTLHQKKKDLTMKLQVMCSSSDSATDGQIKLLDYSQNTKQKLLQRKRDREDDSKQEKKQKTYS